MLVKGGMPPSPPLDPRLHFMHIKKNDTKLALNRQAQLSH